MVAILNLAASNPINAFPHFQIMMMMIFLKIILMKMKIMMNMMMVLLFYIVAPNVSVASNCFLNLILSVCPFAYSNLRGNFPNDYLPTIRFWKSFSTWKI